jgi:hypothetical protein
VLTAATSVISLSSPQQDAITRFVSALLSATSFLADPAAAMVNVAAIATNLNTTATNALAIYETSLLPSSGIINNGNFNINKTGVLNTVNLRNQYGGFSGWLGLHPDFNFDSWVQGLDNGDGGAGNQGLVAYTIRNKAVLNMDGWTLTLGGNESYRMH